MEETSTTATTVPSTLQPAVYPEAAKTAETMQDLLSSGIEIKVLKPGDMVEGSLISAGKNEV